MKLSYIGVIGFLIASGISIQLASTRAKARPMYRIAVIDTGFTPLPFDKTGTKLCKDGHYDYSTKRDKVGLDEIAHGSYVTYLINETAETKNICFMIYKVFGSEAAITDLGKAIDRARLYGAKAINMSVNMQGFEHAVHLAYKKATQSGIKIFTAAGNSNKNLNNYCNEYPPCYNDIQKNSYIVGATDKFHQRERYSNYGIKVAVYDWGNIKEAHGTSFAAPRALGRYIKSLNLDRK